MKALHLMYETRELNYSMKVPYSMTIITDNIVLLAVYFRFFFGFCNFAAHTLTHIHMYFQIP